MIPCLGAPTKQLLVTILVPLLSSESPPHFIASLLNSVCEEGRGSRIFAWALRRGKKRSGRRNLI